MKKVVAVAPYKRKGIVNFKRGPYNAWKKEGGRFTSSMYPIRPLVGFFHNNELKFHIANIREARLRFIEPITRKFDAFPDYMFYEIIPMVWDCWPCLYERMDSWLHTHDIRTAIFTSSQTAERMRKRFPEMNIMYCPEGIDTSVYSEGKQLVERSIDVLEFGRSNEKVLNGTFPAAVNHICTKVNGKFIYTNEELYAAMGDAKVTIALPRSMTQPEVAGDIETLTQRYWENMLSRMVMVGHAPQELIDIIGYNPVIEIDTANPILQITDILTHIEDYQELVDRNRAAALEHGDWRLRMRDVMRWLAECGYEV